MRIVLVTVLILRSYSKHDFDEQLSDIVSARASRLETIELQPWTQAEQLQELGDDDQD